MPNMYKKKGQHYKKIPYQGEMNLRSPWSGGAKCEVALPFTMVSAVKWANCARAPTKSEASEGGNHIVILKTSIRHNLQKNGYRAMLHTNRLNTLHIR